MEDLLYVKEYWKTVFSTEMPEGIEEGQWKVLHRQACGFIRQWVDDNVLNHIIGETHAHTLWQKLEELFARKEGTNKMFLIKQLMCLRYKEDILIADHVNTFQGIINQFSSMEITFEDEVRALLLLGSLSDSREAFKVTVCSSAPNGVVIWNLVKTKILNEESRKVAEPSSSHIQRCWSLSPGGEVRAEVQVKGQKEVGANQKVSMLIMSAITAIRRATLSGNVKNGRKTKRKRRSKIRSKLTVIVT